MLYHIEHVHLQPCTGNERKSTCLGWSGRLGWPPPPHPFFLRHTDPGRGEGCQWDVSCLGILSGGGGGLLWRIYLAGKNGDSFRRTKVGTTLFGGPKWRAFWAGQFGDSGGRVNLASLFSGFLKKGKKRIIQESKVIEKKSKACVIFCRPVICII
jgi:hypothetical protein